MSQKQRLKQLEKKSNGQFLAFFALPRGLCNRKEMELQLWNDYLRDGGNKAATFTTSSHPHMLEKNFLVRYSLENWFLRMEIIEPLD